MNDLIHFSELKPARSPCKRFSHCSISERILYSAFLSLIGIGYLVALANMYYSYENMDGQPGFAITDVMTKYHGSAEQTRLGTAINGIMSANLKNSQDKAVITNWILTGADRSGYEQKIAPILDRDCITCHSPAVNASLPDLTKFETASDLAHAGGTPLPTLLRVAHIHLFGISFVLVFIGKIFLLCDINKTAKRILIALPFVAIFFDISAWFATRLDSNFAYAIVACGGVMGLAIGMQILLSLYQMWFFVGPKRVISYAND